jgi:hypothetical protein
MQKSVKNIVPWLLIVVIFTAVLAKYFMLADGAVQKVLAGQWVIVSACCAALAVDKRPYSINKIFWIFNLVFFGVVPAYQVGAQHFPWFQQFTPQICFRANELIIASMIVYVFVRFFSGKIKVQSPSASDLSDRFLQRYRVLGTIIFAVCCISIVAALGFQNLWLRRVAMAAEHNMNSTLQLIFDKTLRGVILYFTLITVWLYRKQKISLARLIIVLAACLVVSFPLAMPRYLVAALYGSILLTWHFKFQGRMNGFPIAFIIALLVVLPVSGITRHTAEEATAHIKDPRKIYEEALTYGEFDSYATLCKSINYTDSNGVTTGRQLAGAALFFVPRSIWKDKPVGSGAYMYRGYSVLGKTFRSIAAPFYSEGLINFGWLGCLVFVALLALLITVYDAYNWQTNDDTILNFWLLMYPVAMFMIFYMMRGDLMSSFAFTAGFFVSGWVMHRVCKCLPQRR